MILIIRLGIVGGTFNPVHFGHLRSAEEVRERFGLDRVLFITTARPPHKDPSPVVPFDHRHHMLRLALENEPYFTASDMEARRPGRSYSYDTLNELRREYGPEAWFLFIVGLDAFLEITCWKQYREIFGQTAFAVLNRPGYEVRGLKEYIRRNVSEEYDYNEKEEAFLHPRLNAVYYCRTTLMDISSTRIRELVGKRKSIRFLTPERVAHYITEKGLYQG